MDPFELHWEEQEESPPDSPIGQDELDSQTPMQTQNQTPAGCDTLSDDDDYDEMGTNISHSSHPSSKSTPMLLPTSVNSNLASAAATENKEYDYDKEVENVDFVLGKNLSGADPYKNHKMNAIISQFTPDQMNRFEAFRRSGLSKAHMRMLLVGISGGELFSLGVTIVVCALAKMLVGELVEAARKVMTERKDSGPIRPCHIREAYRRLKLQGKIPRRSIQRLFH